MLFINLFDGFFSTFLSIIKAGEKVFLACPVYTFINNIVYYLYVCFQQFYVSSFRSNCYILCGSREAE